MQSTNNTYIGLLGYHTPMEVLVEQGRIQEFSRGGGGGPIQVHVKSLALKITNYSPLGGSGGMPPQECFCNFAILVQSEQRNTVASAAFSGFHLGIFDWGGGGELMERGQELPTLKF